jgi:hypothetical protein
MSEKNQVVRTSEAKALAKQSPTPADLLQIAISNPAVGIDGLQKLMELEERYQARQARAAFYEAMSSFQADAPRIDKSSMVDYTSKNGRTQYSFAGLGTIANAIRPAMRENGLSYRHEIKTTPQSIEVTCVITHSMGHSERTSMSGPMDTSGSKNQIQAAGSTVTYLQRYTLTAALGLTADADDDAQSIGRKITQTEANLLGLALARKGRSKEKLCATYGVESIDQLHIQQYEAAMKLMDGTSSFSGLKRAPASGENPEKAAVANDPAADEEGYLARLAEEETKNGGITHE